MTESTAQETLNYPAIENLLQVLVKGLRAIQLYLPNNPVYQKAVENIRLAFQPIWEDDDQLVLVVEETDLAADGVKVLVQPTKSESVAWVLYKDGIRSVTLLRGVEEREIIRFLHALHKARNLAADAADDLLTLLWEEDFECIRYEFVEVGRHDAVPLAPVEAEEKPPATEQVHRTVQEEAQEPEPPMGLANIEDFDSTLYFLSDEEIAYLKGEIEREYNQDLRRNVLTMLFDLLELQTYGTVRAELISIAENFIPYLLAVGDFPQVAYILREIRVVMQRAREVLPEHRKQLEHLPAKLSEPEALAQLLQSLDEALVHPTEEELGELFRELRPEALETLLGWLPRLTNERVRALLDHAAQRLAQAYPERLTAALKTDDDNILMEAIRLSSRLKLPPVVPVLGELLRGRGPEVRRAVADALATIGTPGALQQLEFGIDDDDRDVRITAVRVLGNRGHRAAFQRIEAAVTGKGLRDADLTEKTVFFEAYGLLAGEGGIATLRDMIEVKGFLRRKEDPQIRACAAMALGKIGTDAARKILEAAKGDKDPLVRNAINKALREIV